MVEAANRGVVFEALDAEQCRTLLSSHNVGRVAVSIDALPVILPVNYAVDGDDIVFRTTPGTKLSAALLKTVVAFEVDEYEPNGDVGWSVLVQGRATELDVEEGLARARELPLRLISDGGEADRFVRIKIATVSGRRLRPRFEGTS